MRDTESLERWLQDASACGWVLPHVAPPWMRVWGIRHLRALVLMVRIERHYSRAPGIRTGYDEWVLWAVLVGLA